ncbi:hypothetical protein Q7C36_014270 [Tachysurus vachellii]|uniref:Uncharacterized protein n=1 Tax=Tachysurus vachellii TaxID=175792 RepID=A0AA88MEC2_TACVA|nr:hypothetical protein Q7C36_014270 [Tachysurus vachellii]
MRKRPCSVSNSSGGGRGNIQPSVGKRRAERAHRAAQRTTLSPFRWEKRVLGENDARQKLKGATHVQK